MSRAACYCPSNPQITCAACVPAHCACGRVIPVHALRLAFKRNASIICKVCKVRTSAQTVAIEYLGL